VSTSDGAASDVVAVDYQEVLDYVTTLWAQRMADTVTEAARWRAVATAAQRTLAELQARVEVLERGPDAAAAG